MLVGRVGGKIVVAYDDIKDAVSHKSCIACMRYGSRVPCRLYSICRAENKIGEPPAMFVEAMREIIEKRCTEIKKEDKNELKRHSIKW